MEGIGSSGPHTRAIAGYAASFGEKDLTPDLVARAKEIVLDTIGAILLGSRPEYAGVRILADLAVADGSGEEAGGSTIFGRKSKGRLDAVLANGTMGYAADAEGAGTSRMHAAAVFVPAVLTMGEYVHASGPDAIAALVLAYDVAGRISDAADPALRTPIRFILPRFSGISGRLPRRGTSCAWTSASSSTRWAWPGSTRPAS